MIKLYNFAKVGRERKEKELERGTYFRQVNGEEYSPVYLKHVFSTTEKSLKVFVFSKAN